MEKILADYHTHTVFCHGNGTILDNVKQAKERGLVEVAITNHSFNHWNCRIRPKNFYKVVNACREAEKETGVRVLVGVEANLINQKGKIDVPKKIEEQCDIIVAGPHQAVWMNLFLFIRINVFYKLLKRFFKKKIAKMQYTEKTKRLIRQDKSKFVKKNTMMVANMLRNNNIDILVHPGRSVFIDVVEIAKVCAETDTYFELNARSGRFNPDELEILKTTGCKFVFNTDSHEAEAVGCTLNDRSKKDALELVLKAGVVVENYTKTIKLKNHKG